MRSLLGLAGLLLVLAAGIGPAAAAAADCPQMQFVGVRGSGQNPPAGTNGAGFFGPDIGAVLSAVNGQVPGNAGQRGVGNVAVDYPAIAAQPLSLSFANRYVDSVRRGSARLNTLIKQVKAACPSTPVVLAGYSQGAQVIQRYLRLRGGIPRNISGIALLGDPLFRQAQGDGIGVGTFVSNVGGIARFARFPHLREPNGKYSPAFGGPQRWPTSLRGRVMSICMGGDPICGPKASPTEAGNCLVVTCNHYRYPIDTIQGVAYTTHAANFLVGTARSRFTPPAAAPAPVAATPTFSFQVTGTCRDGCGLTVRGGTPGPSGTLLGSLPDGTTVGVRCQVRGAVVRGTPGTNDVWDQILYGGQVAYVSDLYLNTPGGVTEGASHFSPGIPRC